MYLKKNFPKLPFFREAQSLISRLNSYEVELKFYRNYAEEIKNPTPKCYYNYEDYYNVYFFICLQDLTKYEIGQPDGFSFDASLEIVKNIAEFHTLYWKKPYFVKKEKMKHIWEHGGYWLGNKEMDHTKSIIMSWDMTLKNLSSVLNPKIILKIEGLGKILEDISQLIYSLVHKFKPRTIIHGDYKISNLFFDDGIENGNKKKKKKFTL